MKKKTFQNRPIWFFAFISPCVLALLFVVLIPFLYGIYYSFRKWDGVSIDKFIGLQNYINIISDGGFWHSMSFTATFAIVCVVLINVIGLSLALLVSEKFKGANFLRTIFFMPNLIGGLILGFIWQFIFVKGFTAIGDLVGIESMKTWLSTTDTGFWALVIVLCWQMSGYVMIIYIAYIQGIDSSLLEAARIDGCVGWKQFWKIKFPLIMPGFTVSLFLTLSNCFKLYDQNLSLTNGGPNHSTEMVAMNIYNQAFSNNQMGYAQAQAVIFFICVAVVALVQVYVTSKREVEA